MMSRDVLLTLAYGVFLGWLIWALSPLIAGHKEPWDATFAYYPFALGISGLVIGIASGKRFWIGVIGVFLGQAITVYLQIFWAEFSRAQEPHAPGYQSVGISFPLWFPALWLHFYNVWTMGGALVGWLLQLFGKSARAAK